MEQILTKDTFDAHMNTIFQVELAEDDSVELKLVKSREIASTGVEGFSLIFVGAADRVLFDDTYRFKHDQMGTFDIFISPYRQEGDRVYYDVHFTKILDQD